MFKEFVRAAVAGLFLATAHVAVVAAPAEQTQQSAAEKAYMAKLDALQWVRGPTTVDVVGDSTLTIPAGYVFLNEAETNKFLELNQNLGSGTEVMIAPESLGWSAYFGFADEGYVKDDEKIDADALLKTLQENTQASNEARRQRGWDELQLTGWAAPPAYNSATKRLEWATRLRSRNGESVNFLTKVLGRKGHTTVILATSPQDLATSRAALETILSGYGFKPGNKYSEYVAGDKVAEYGLAALVLGGAAAIATKKGLWSVIAAFLAASWKFLAAALFGGAAWLRRLFAKKTRVMPAIEIALPAGAILFYLYDCLLPLYDNEVIFIRRRKAWQATMGADIVLLGKRLSAPALLAPWALLFRAYWTDRSPPAPLPDDAQLDRLATALLPLRILCTSMGLLLVLVLPVVSVWRGAGIEMLGVVALFYLLGCGALGVVIVRRRALGLDARGLLSLAVDALACGPFAVNLVSKVTLRAAPWRDPLGFAAAHFTVEAERQLRMAVARRMNDLKTEAVGP